MVLVNKCNVVALERVVLWNQTQEQEAKVAMSEKEGFWAF